MEQTLSKDINGIYSAMDFHTRDNYRHSVEKIAKHSKFTEQEIAAMAIQFAQENSAENDDPRLAHVGYYLTCNGLAQLKKHVKPKFSKIDICKNAVNKVPLLAYLGGIFVLTALFSWALFSKAWHEGFNNTILVGLSIIILLATSRESLGN